MTKTKVFERTETGIMLTNFSGDGTTTNITFSPEFFTRHFVIDVVIDAALCGTSFIVTADDESEAIELIVDDCLSRGWTGVVKELSMDDVELAECQGGIAVFRQGRAYGLNIAQMKEIDDSQFLEQVLRAILFVQKELDENDLGHEYQDAEDIFKKIAGGNLVVTNDSDTNVMFCDITKIWLNSTDRFSVEMLYLTLTGCTLYEHAWRLLYRLGMPGPA